MSWEGLIRALPYLALLACPAMMIWMMRDGGSRDGGHAHPHALDAVGSVHTPPPSATEEKKFAELRARLARLEAERERDREESWRSD